MTKTWKLLWVEDDHYLIDAVMLILRKKGWVIKICPDHDSALRAIDEEDFDVYIVDLILPSGDDGDTSVVENDLSKRYLGLSLIQHIREKYDRDVPVAVFSVVYDTAVNRRLHDLGVKAKFSKGTTTSNADLCDKIELAAETGYFEDNF